MMDITAAYEKIKKTARKVAEVIQLKSDTMTGTEMYAESPFIPSFTAACTNVNMLKRTAGFMCKSSAGRIVKLLQPYDSTVYTQEPEELPEYWSCYWSTDPEKALPFIALSTSPYMTGDCCTENDKIYRSLIDNNISAPSTNVDGWEEVV